MGYERADFEPNAIPFGSENRKKTILKHMVFHLVQKIDRKRILNQMVFHLVQNIKRKTVPN